MTTAKTAPAPAIQKKVPANSNSKKHEFKTNDHMVIRLELVLFAVRVRRYLLLDGGGGGSLCGRHRSLSFIALRGVSLHCNRNTPRRRIVSSPDAALSSFLIVEIISHTSSVNGRTKWQAVEFAALIL